MVNLEEIYFFGQPTSLEDAVETLERQFQDICDLETIQREVDRKYIGKDRIRISFSLELFWTSLPDWEERRVNAVVHVVFMADRSTWTATQLVVDRHFDVNAEAPVAHALAPRDIPDPLAQAGAVNAAAPATQPVCPEGAEAAAEATAMYFANEKQPEAPPAQIPIATGNHSRHLLYMPVIVDRDTLRALLDS